MKTKQNLEISLTDVKLALDYAILGVMKNFGDNDRYATERETDEGDGMVRVEIKRNRDGSFSSKASLDCGRKAERRHAAFEQAIDYHVDEIMPSRRARLKSMLQLALQDDETGLVNGDLEVNIKPSYIVDDKSVLVLDGGVRHAGGLWSFIYAFKRCNRQYAVGAVLRMYDEAFD